MYICIILSESDFIGEGGGGCNIRMHAAGALLTTSVNAYHWDASIHVTPCI